MIEQQEVLYARIEIKNAQDFTASTVEDRFLQAKARNKYIESIRDLDVKIRPDGRVRIDWVFEVAEVDMGERDYSTMVQYIVAKVFEALNDANLQYKRLARPFYTQRMHWCR